MEILLVMNLSVILFLKIAGVYSIENGRLAERTQFPYVVSIQRLRQHYCSGTIVDEKHILTVAHPITAYGAPHLAVIADTTLARHRIFRIQKIYIHPEFERLNISEQLDDEYSENDIAILRLHDTLIWTPTVARVPLAGVEPAWSFCLDCDIISWHYFEVGGRTEVVLMWEMIKFLSDETGPIYGTQLLSNQKYFNDIVDQSAINLEDLGSPIVCNGFMIGLVVKGGRRDVPEKPSTLLSVVPYLGFIAEIIKDGLFDVQAGEFPYVASIWYMYTHRCGGFIVDATRIVTTGHCVRGATVPLLKVVVGHNQVSQFDLTIDWLSVNNIILASGDGLIECDLAILILSQPILWNPAIAPLLATDLNNFADGQVCEVLRWKLDTTADGAESITLKVSYAKLWNYRNDQHAGPSAPSRETVFWARSLYSMPIAESRDTGNPIICGGYLLGFLIGAIDARKGFRPAAKFGKISLYGELISSSASTV